MSINSTKKALKVFVAASRDVSIERAKAQQIISDLNQETTLIKSLDIQFAVKNWLEIKQSVEITDWDIFVGILWLDLDTYSNQSAFTVNLERKIINAYRKWKETNISHFLLYRCVRTPSDPLDIDPEKLKKIEDVFLYADPPGLSSMIRHPLSDPIGVRRVYCDVEEFGQYFSHDVTRILNEYAADYNPTNSTFVADQTITGDIGWSPGNKIINAIDEEHPYVMSVLSIEIENHDELKKILTYNQINLLKKKIS